MNPGLRSLVLVLAALLLAGCDKPPLVLGFMAGLTGRSADLGVAGRDAVVLAVEQANAAGGIAGRRVELLVVDDQQDPVAARAAFDRLRTAGVELAVGPMTSAMATEVVPLANQSPVLLVSPTVTTSALGGLDDRMFRVISSTREYAIKSARHHAQRTGLRRVAAILDEGNAAYTQRWLDDFTAEFTRAGGSVVSRTPYRYHPEISFSQLVASALQQQPDGVLVLAGAADAAQMAQQLRKLAPALPMMTSEWAATEQFIALGGAAVNGIHMAQFMDRDNQSPAYRAFQQVFQQRFGRAPGFPEVASYDAAQVALRAMRERRDGEDYKQTLLRLRRFEALQQTVEFDGFGDAQRETHITVVRDGRYVVER